MSFSRKGLGFQRRKKPRKVGDAPTIGHVPRLHKNAKRRRGRRSFSGRIPKILRFLAALAFIAATAGLVLRFANDPDKEIRPPVTTTPPPLSPDAQTKIPPPEPQELERITRAFLAARTPEELAPLIRNSAQPPETIAQKLATLESTDGKLDSVQCLGPIDSHCLQIESVLVKFDTGRNRIALVTPDNEGVWRIDFDAFDRHVTPDWATILSGKPGESTVRVSVSEDSYYNGRFQDDKQWACFSLASSDHESLMFGYAPRGSSQHLAVAAALQRNPAGDKGSLKRMTLTILHTGTGDHRQFEITRALADEWALGDVPLDARADAPEASSTR